MKISELNLPSLPHLTINRTASGRYVGETAEIKTIAISYMDGYPSDCYFTVEVSTGAIIEVRVEDVDYEPAAEDSSSATLTPTRLPSALIS